jgi:SAM-dependent methyltransferase
MPVSRADVLWAYRSLLGREPESDRVVDLHCRAPDFRSLCESFIGSDEYKNRRFLTCRGRGPTFGLVPPLRIDTTADAHELRLLWNRTKRTWTTLGEDRPFHSVLTDDRFSPQRVAAFESEFWESGELEAKTFIDYLASLGAPSVADATLIEFGCGVGRVTVPLARRCGRVVAYDISAPHLALARERAAMLGCTNIYTIAIDKDVPTEFEPCDVFYSRIVLQHNPPPIIGHILRKLIGALRRGGIGVFQVPTYCAGYRFDLSAALKSRQPLDMEMHCFPQGELFSLIAEAGAQCIEVREDDAPGRSDLYISNSIVLARVV